MPNFNPRLDNARVAVLKYISKILFFKENLK